MIGVALVAAAATAPVVHTSLRDVRACLVRDDGVMVATSGGVASLAKNGAVARVLTALDGLPDGRAHALHAQGKDVWIGTERGAALFANGAIARTVLASRVTSIASLGNDTYFGTFGNGVSKNGLVPVLFAGDLGSARNKVAGLAASEGRLIAATLGGTFELRDGKLQALSSTPSLAVALHEGRVFAGGVEGLLSFGPGGPRSEAALDVRALAVVDGALVAGAFGGGAVRIGKSLEKIASAGPFVQAIGAQGKARCFGTNDGVVVSFDGVTFSTHLREGLPSPDVSALAHDGARLWVGTFDRGLGVIEGAKARAVESTIDRNVNALVHENGTLWVATARGLYAASIAKDGSLASARRFTESDGLPSNDVHAVVASKKGGVIVGTSKGAAIVRGGVVQPLGKKQGVTGEAVWALVERDDGLVLGTNAGLLIPSGGKWERLSVLSGHLPDDWITSVVQHGDALLVGTYAGGVVHVERAADGWKATRWGGGSINPAGLAVIDGRVHAATMDGLLVRVGTAWQKLNGVLGADVTAVVPMKTSLAIATRRGVVVRAD